MVNKEIPCKFASGCVAESYVRLLQKEGRTEREENSLEGYRAQLELLPDAVCQICPVRSARSDLFNDS